MTEEEIKRAKDELDDIEWRLTNTEDEVDCAAYLCACPGFGGLKEALDATRYALMRLKDCLENAWPGDEG